MTTVNSVLQSAVLLGSGLVPVTVNVCLQYVPVFRYRVYSCQLSTAVSVNIVPVYSDQSTVSVPVCSQLSTDIIPEESISHKLQNITLDL